MRATLRGEYGALGIGLSAFGGSSVIALLGLSATVQSFHLWSRLYGTIFVVACIISVCGFYLILAIFLPLPVPPLRGEHTPRAMRKPPAWRDGIAEMRPRQIAHLEALEHERAGYLERMRRVKKGMPDQLGASASSLLVDRLKQVDDQIRRARDEWWEKEPGEAAAGEPKRSVQAITVSVPDRPCERYPAHGGGECVYCHLEVAAPSDLRRCHARLIRVTRAVSQQWVTDSRFATPTRLKWANVGPEHPEAEYRDIRRGESALLDVLYTLEHSPGRAFIETLDAQPVDPSRALQPGQYLLTVRVMADDRDSVDCTVSVGVPDARWWHAVSLGSYVGPPIAPVVSPEPEPFGDRAISDMEGGPHDTAVAFRLSAPSSPHMHVISFTTGFLNERHLATPWRPVGLRFLSPVRAEVRATDPLPATVPCGTGHLLIKRFTETGFLVEEIDTVGEQVQAEVYLDESGGPESVPSYKVRVVNELIERGVAVQHSIDSQFPQLAAETAEGWVRECWERLGEAVEGLRGLFHMQTYAGSTPAEISGYIEQRLAELREILRRVA